MKILSLIVIFLYCVFCTHAQTFSNKELIGRWRVEQVVVDSDFSRSNPSNLMLGTFTFAEDGMFSFDFKTDDTTVVALGWRVDTTSSTILIPFDSIPTGEIDFTHIHLRRDPYPHQLWFELSGGRINIRVRKISTPKATGDKNPAPLISRQ